MKLYRQGDVCIVKIDTKLHGTAEPRTGGRVVLAYGEVTGHAHAIHDEAVTICRDADVVAELARELVAKKIFQADWRVDALLEIAGPASLRHEEHGTIKLDAGKYAVIRQREYSPEALRQVAD